MDSRRFLPNFNSTISRQTKRFRYRKYFYADDHDGGISSDTSRVNFVWLSFDTLKVSFDKRLRVFKMKPKIKDATIVYDSLSMTK